MDTNNNCTVDTCVANVNTVTTKCLPGKHFKEK